MIAPPGYALADELRRAVATGRPGQAVVTCLPPDPDERHLGWLLEGARFAVEHPEIDRFVLVQHGGEPHRCAHSAPGGSLARHLRGRRTDRAPAALEWIIAEAEAAFGFTEVHYDRSGRRREPVVRLLDPAGDGQAELDLGPRTSCS